MQHDYTYEPRTTIGAFIPPDLKRAAAALAFVRGVSLSAVIRDSLTEYIDQHGELVESAPPTA